jgi:hypothetical protein
MAMSRRDLESGGEPGEDFVAAVNEGMAAAREYLAELEAAYTDGRLLDATEHVPSVREQFARVQAERS